MQCKIICTRTLFATPLAALIIAVLTDYLGVARIYCYIGIILSLIGVFALFRKPLRTANISIYEKKAKEESINEQ